MSITHRQADDLLEERYGDGDPDWWQEMVEALMKYPSVRALRRAEDGFGGRIWRIPAWWPGSSRPAVDVENHA